ncbi:MAG: fatty-acid oxidation protein subunit alpha [Lewinellaceae bacterium]|nr:fatty-acid oxidation protein subunit alpha [Lewinellaceae bacterium]
MCSDSFGKDGWTITDDPLTIPTPGVEFYVDLGAEKAIIGAEKQGNRIAVEIKSLKGNSYFYDFYQALGQFLIYKLAIEKTNALRILYLAIPDSAYRQLHKVEVFREVWQVYKVHLLIFDEKKQNILAWISN